MSQDKSSYPDHNELASNSHGSAVEADALLCLLDLQPGTTVLDMGCGQGGYTLRLLDIYPSIDVTGVDANVGVLAQAREQATRAGVADRLTLADPSQVVASASFDAAVCIGAAQLFGSYADALRSLAAQVKPGGLMLIAAGHWKGASPGTTTGFYPDHAANVAAAEAAALVPLYSIVNDDEVWDDHADLYAQATERHIAAHPNDIEALATRDRVHSLCGMNLRLGRGMLGHGWYLFWKG